MWRKLKRKSASLHWEAMFTRSTFETADILEQHKLLTEVSRLVEAGKIKTTLGETFGLINARQSQARSRAHRERQGQGQDRAGRVLTGVIPMLVTGIQRFLTRPSKMIDGSRARGPG